MRPGGEILNYTWRATKNNSRRLLAACNALVEAKAARSVLKAWGRAMRFGMCNGLKAKLIETMLGHDSLATQEEKWARLWAAHGDHQEAQVVVDGRPFQVG